MTRYTAITDADLEAMLATIGVSSVEELFARQIPEEMRLRRDLSLPPGIAEQDVYEHLRALARRNVSVEQQISFLGAGMYDHYVPALIDMLCERSELLTPYTPYQPEVSQGSLQIMFEYQTAICELTGLPVANASVYDGPSAVAQAAYMATLAPGGSRGPVRGASGGDAAGVVVASAGLHPHALQTLRTHARGFGCEVVEVPLARDGSGRTDPEAWRAALAGGGARGGASGGGGSHGRVIAAVFAQPNFYGVVEEAPALCDALTGARREPGAAPPTAIAQVDPITLGLLRPPGECGVDIAVGEGQPLGGRLDFGGPSFGFFAARAELLRTMPGRIAGETRDADGRRGFVLTLQTREQHIRRERATSNICTAQALNALAGLVYLCWLGRRGLVELGELLLARTQYARRALCELPGVTPLHTGPVVRELALHLDADVAAVRRHCIEHGVNPGADLHALTRRPQDRGGLLVALTERRSRDQIDRLVAVLGDALREQCGGPARACAARPFRPGQDALHPADPGDPRADRATPGACPGGTGATPAHAGVSR